MRSTTARASTVFGSLTTLAIMPASAAFAQIDPHGGMLRYPDISATQITFVYANDIWVAPREGGMAIPLAAPEGAEMFPKFSPDGKAIAFQGNYEGGIDLYIVDIPGGVPARVTHHPAGEQLSEWTADGRLIFSTNGMAGLGRQQQIFTVARDGGLPEQVPVPFGAAGAVSPDGTWLAYTPFNRDFRTWKRYRGGLASDIWLFNLNDNSARQITDWEGTDTQPMWHGNTVYYLSDRGEQARLNIWAYDVNSGQHRQVTTFDEFDVKWPSIGPGQNEQGEIIFQYGSDLRILNLANGRSRTIEVTIPGDRPTIRPQLEDVSDELQSAGISSTGKRAVIGARGDVFSVPGDKGITRHLIDSDGAFERDPSWSPDGRWIAYFSDATGEYELYITQSDGKGETRQLTKDSATFYYTPIWSPDSKKIFFTDKGGRKMLVDVEAGELKVIDRDPYFNNPSVSWSHDSRWITYSKSPDHLGNSSIWLYNVENGETHQVTSGMFSDSSPVFDRKGDFLYFVSARSFSPTYSDVDTTFIYHDSQLLFAVPLREDVKNPFAPKNDEEEFKEEEEETDEEAEGGEGDEGDDEGAEEGGEEEEEEEAQQQDEPAEDDGLSGTWECTVTGDQLPPGGLQVTLILTLNDDGTVTGTLSSPMGSGSFTGSFNAATGDLNGTITTEMGDTVTLSAKVTDGNMEGTVTGEGFAGQISGRRTSTGGADEEAAGDEAEKPAETVEIDLEGFEARAIQLPLASGRFGQTAVNDRNQLLFVRFSTRGAAGAPAIKVFDINEETKSEKDVATGVGNFDISGDGKKILIRRGNSLSIQNAGAGGSPTNVSLAGLNTRIDPREEWRQIFNEAWRLQRDFFYDPRMHGVDWPAIRTRYETMLEDAVDREDVGYVISEMISEINVGHAYYGGNDAPGGPNSNVGMLGVDFALENGAYKITRIYEGGDWDTDARNPLNAPGVDVNEGDYILAVNGRPLDTSKDPWASFIGLENRTVLLTVSEDAELNDNDREVLVDMLSNESNLRYRAWIEHNRKYVEEKTDGKVGYVYVPDTGVNGQTNLVRQFFGQIHKQAMIVDERWNGGGQIPTRFIEILNRPAVNYWARRDFNDWTWPPDAHQGPKCMLINGPSGSGGDAFPYYFRQAGIGKLIGTRTWGGLVGISGSPGLIDGARVTVPTFAFYEVDGTWGVEGHGVDPDIEVIADPSKMVDGGDPQLDAAIALMLEEIETNPYVKPERPEYPVRIGVGISEEDK